MIQEDSKIQRPVYYANQAFQGAEAKYPLIEKITFTLIIASRKLGPYFQANPILVMVNQPIKKAMSKLEATDRMVQWVIELSQFDIKYRPRTTIKSQVLAGFIARFTLPKESMANSSELQTIQMDGSSVKKMSRVEVIITSLEGHFQICGPTPIPCHQQ